MAPCQGDPMGSQGGHMGDTWDPSVSHGIPGWALEDPLALGGLIGQPLGTMGPWALGTSPGLATFSYSVTLFSDVKRIYTLMSRRHMVATESVPFVARKDTLGIRTKVIKTPIELLSTFSSKRQEKINVLLR